MREMKKLRNKKKGKVIGEYLVIGVLRNNESESFYVPEGYIPVSATAWPFGHRIICEKKSLLYKYRRWIRGII